MFGVTRGLTDTLAAVVEESSVVDAGRPDNWSIDGGVTWFVSAGITLRRRRSTR